MRNAGIPESDLMTIRIGKGTKLHAMKRDGVGMCADVGLVRTFGNGNTEIVKVADGTWNVDCDACEWGLKHEGVFAFPFGKLL
jgi:hypothetical protein